MNLGCGDPNLHDGVQRALSSELRPHGRHGNLYPGGSEGGGKGVRAASVNARQFAPAHQAPANPAKPQKLVIGFYPGWQVSKLPLEDIDYSSLTHIVMFAIRANPDGSLLTDFFIDRTNGPAYAIRAAALAHAAGKKALLAIGGSGFRAELAAAASQRSTRAVLIKNLLDTMASLGFDGIDVDWEPIERDDYENYLSLVREIRLAKPNIILSADLPGAINMNNNAVASAGASAFLSSLSTYLDHMHLMTYGMSLAYSGWLSWFTSPLRGEHSDSPMSVNATVQAYVSAGVPADKIVVGITFEGQSLGPKVTSPRQFLGANTTQKVVSYNDIMAMLYTEDRYHFDLAAQAAYLSISPPITGVSYVSYEDASSIEAKANFARDQGLAGAAIWELASGSRSLLQVVSNAFNPSGDIQPDTFTLVDVRNASRSTTYESNIITVSGITVASPIRVVNGEYQKNGGSWAKVGMVNNGDSIRVRGTSSAVYDASVEVTLTIGGVTDIFEIRSQTASP